MSMLRHMITCYPCGVLAVCFLGLSGGAKAAAPNCPTPAQGYEISGCFVDPGGDEYAAGGTVTVHDLAFGQALSQPFPGGTFTVDAFNVASPSNPPPSCNACGAVDYCVVTTFNALPGVTADAQVFCADGRSTVNQGGFDLRGLTGGKPPIVTFDPPSPQVFRNGFE